MFAVAYADSQRRYSTSNRLTLRCSDFTLKCIGCFSVYLNIAERSNRLRVLLGSY